MAARSFLLALCGFWGVYVHKVGFEGFGIYVGAHVILGERVYYDYYYYYHYYNLIHLLIECTVIDSGPDSYDLIGSQQYTRS